MVGSLSHECEEDGIEVPCKIVPLCRALRRIEKDCVKLFLDVACLIGQSLTKVIRGYTKETRDLIKDGGIGNVCGYVACVPFTELEVTKEQNGDKKAENGSDMLGLKAKNLHCHPQFIHSDGVVAERTSWKAV